MTVVPPLDTVRRVARRTIVEQSILRRYPQSELFGWTERERQLRNGRCVREFRSGSWCARWDSQKGVLSVKDRRTRQVVLRKNLLQRVETTPHAA